MNRRIKTMTPTFSAAICAFVCFSSGGAAQTVDAAAFAACASVEEATARLACYDAAAARLSKAPLESDPASTPNQTLSDAPDNAGATAGALGASAAQSADAEAPNVVSAARPQQSDEARERAAQAADAGAEDIDEQDAVAASSPAAAEFGAEDLAPSREEKKEREKKPKTLRANIVEIALNARKRYVVVLDNGQVWRQLRADTARLLLPKDPSGAAVTVRRKRFGGYSLSLEGDNRSIRVERLK